MAELTQWIHMLAGACWAGGLVLLILLLRERRDGEPPAEEARRYSSMAVVAISVVVVSGLARAVNELGGWSALGHIWSSSYGRTLVVKVAVVLIVIALGALNRLRNVARVATDTRPLRRIVAVEIVAVAGILLLTATLTSFPPPASAVDQHGAPAASNELSLSGSDFATTIQLTLTVTPGLPGPNLYRAAVVQYGTEQPAAADAVTLHLRSITRPDLPDADVKLRLAGRRLGRAGARSVGGGNVPDRRRRAERRHCHDGAADPHHTLDRHDHDDAGARRRHGGRRVLRRRRAPAGVVLGQERRPRST